MNNSQYLEAIRAEYDKAFALFKDEYAYKAQVDQVNSDLYGSDYLTKHPNKRFVTERPPFLLAGNLEIPGAKYLGFGLNPRSSSLRPVPTTEQEYYEQARDRFYEPASSYHRYFLAILGGLGLPDVPSSPPNDQKAWASWLPQHFLVADLLPYWAKANALSKLNPIRVHYFRKHFAHVERLLRGQDLHLIIFSGKLFEELFLTAPENLRLGPVFTKGTSIVLKNVKGYDRALIAGTLHFAGNEIPALIGTHFLMRIGVGYKELKAKTERLCRSWIIPG